MAVKLVGVPPRRSSGQLMAVILAIAATELCIWSYAVTHVNLDNWQVVAVLLVIATLGELGSFEPADDSGTAYSISAAGVVAACVFNPILTLVASPFCLLLGEAGWTLRTRRLNHLRLPLIGLITRSVINVANMQIGAAVAAAILAVASVEPAPTVALLAWYCVATLGDVVPSLMGLILGTLAGGGALRSANMKRHVLVPAVVQPVAGASLVMMAAVDWWLPIVPGALFLLAARFSHTQVTLIRQLSSEPVSGLLSRQAFLTRLSKSVDSTRTVGVLTIREFAGIAEALGQDTANKLVAQFAEDLTDRLGARAASRTAADVFAFDAAVVSGDPREVEAEVGAIAADLPAQYDFEGIAVPVRLRVGAAIGGQSLSPWRLLLRAETAAATSDGRVVLGTTDAASTAREDLSLAGELQRALSSGEITAYYQPITSSDGVTIIGAEALARWEHPTRGLLKPASFMELVDRMGLGADLTTLMVQTVCADVAQWTRAGLEITANVNVSASDIGAGDLPELIARSCAARGISPSTITVEITEQAATMDPVATTQAMDGLHQLGCRVAIDDFGTGQSSLSRIAGFPFDELKIDRTFIANLADRRTAVTLANLIRLGKDLDLAVVAEGIEDLGLVSQLARLGVDKLQGYALGRPVPPGTFVGQAGMLAYQPPPL